MKEQYNWAVLGPGRIANKLADSLKILPKANLYAVGSRALERAQNFAEQHGFKKAYGSYEELMQDEDVDIIYIATPHTGHAKYAIECLNHKKAVLCEKPFAMNADLVKQMIAAAKENDLFLMEALWTRFLPHIEKVIEIINSGKIGELSIVEADFGFIGNPDPNWRVFNPALGGGSLLDVGIYPIFLIMYLLGFPKEISSFAKLTDQNVDKSCTAIFNYERALATMHSSVVAQTKTEANIFGSKGRLRLLGRFFTPTDIVIYDNEENSEKIHVPFEGNGFNYQAQEVMDCLDKGLKESPKWPLQSSLELSKIMDKIIEQCGMVYPD